MAIIQMPFKSVAPPNYTGAEPKDADVIWQFHGDDDIPDTVKPMKLKRAAASDGRITKLPLRQRRQSLKSKDKHPANDYENQILGEKHPIQRDLNSKAVTPVIGGIAQLLQAEQTVQLVEAEYEVVRLPIDDGKAPDSDSESAGFVEVHKEDADLQQIQLSPDRTRRNMGEPQTVGPSDGSDSESEWTMI